MDQELTDFFDAQERGHKVSRQANEDVLNGALAGGAVVISQQAAMATQGLLNNPDFSKVQAG